MTKPTIKFVKLDEDAVIPAQETPGSAGADVTAIVRDDEGRVNSHGIELSPGGSILVATGLQMEIPQGFEVQLRPRSGLALKFGITLLNSPATIDSDYRGPLGIIVINHGVKPFIIKHMMRIAQMVVAPVCGFNGVEVGELSNTGRGSGGFGSTGIMAENKDA